jgi:hypothetical protein
MAKESLDEGLIAHWPFAGDCEDHAGHGLVVQNHGVDLDAIGPQGKPVAAFNGEDAFIKVQDHPVLQLGKDDFTIAAWIQTDAEDGDVVGNLISKFDPGTRKGVQLYISTNTGVTSTAQPNYRNLHFGIDDGRLDPQWADCGRPGNAVLITALKVFKGALYAGTLEIGADEMGHLWRYEGGGRWMDLGNPLGCNVVHSVAEFNGELYAGVGCYNCPGSLLGATRNLTPGGKVYRVTSDGRWVYCGQPGAEDATPEEVPIYGYTSGKADDVFALTVYRGNLYCTSAHRRGAFVYEGGENWKYIGPEHKMTTFTVYHGGLYTVVATGPVYRYEGGSKWSYCGRPGTRGKLYSGVTYGGQLYVGLWPEGEVCRYEGGEEWAPGRRVRYEREIMAMVLYNGKVYVGALPMANVYRMDGEGFTFVGNLDASPVQLRRVWSMAVYQGELFAGTLPSGHVYSIAAGKMATWDHAFPAGWHHVAAAKEGGVLRVYVDGRPVATSADKAHPTGFSPGDYDLDNDQPLQIGFGSYDYYRGLMSDLRLYKRALAGEEMAILTAR